MFKNQMIKTTTMKERLLASISTELCEIIDESAGHIDHLDNYKRGGAGDVSHVKIRIKADCFCGIPTVKCHQMIYKIFDTELKSGEIHAMTIELVS